ncbi:hypothetical protein [Paenibacillus alvei]|uniref:hypothetical protein n=1 Tax=Paenibacillus alvei TaxID=44250 RepID=UPI000407CCD3|nr:hypothetical protein [Paenibacillus alvei]
MTEPIAIPDLSLRSYQLTVEREMETPPAVLYKAWTRWFDRWFAEPGTVMMMGEVNTVFILKRYTALTRSTRPSGIRITVDFSASNRIG